MYKGQAEVLAVLIL